VLGTKESAAEFAQAGDQYESGGEQSNLRIGQDSQVGAQACDAEENGRKKCGDQAAQLFVDVARQDRRFADEDAGDKRAEHRVHADHVSDQRHDAHDDENCGDYRVFC
jgi:hypothetical protein